MRDLLDFQRGQIVGVRLAGASVTKTATLLGVSRAAVSQFMTAYTNFGKTSSSKRNYLFYFIIFSGSTAQCGLWPPVALQPSVGYGLLWHCSPVRTMASCGTAAQCGLWPPVALQPSVGYGLLWHCSPAWALASLFMRFLDHTQ
jgi:hypothetical protein